MYDAVLCMIATTRKGVCDSRINCSPLHSSIICYLMLVSKSQKQPLITRRFYGWKIYSTYLYIIFHIELYIYIYTFTLLYVVHPCAGYSGLWQINETKIRSISSISLSLTQAGAPARESSTAIRAPAVREGLPARSALHAKKNQRWHTDVQLYPAVRYCST